MIIESKQSDYDKYVKMNADGYSRAVVVAGEKVMKALADGKTVKESHDEMYGQGLSGFQAGCVATSVREFSPRGGEFGKFWDQK